jgi:serine/threonine protein kinase
VIRLLEALQSWDPASVGPFRLVGVLGTGGFGRVFLGQSREGQRVAVKVVKPELAADPEFRARFRREVAAARSVSGQFTARVVDADLDGEGGDGSELWLATAYISGPTLREAVAADGPLAEGSVLILAAGLAEALAAIHQAGLVHRDLKPDNVLLAFDGPRVIDFGIARMAAGANTLTSTGTLLGTLAYMSPEQARGQAVGPPSDVYSLGSVLVFAATGQGPYGDGQPAQLLYRVAHEAPNLDRVPPPVRSLVERCMAADPGRRPDAGELLGYLGAARPAVGWLETATMTAVKPDPGGRPPIRTVPASAPPASAPPASAPPGSAHPASAHPATVAASSAPAYRGPSYPLSANGAPANGAPPATARMPDPGRRPRTGARRLRIGVIALVAAVLIGVGVAYGVGHFGAKQAAPPTAASWSGGQRIDTVGLTSISCAGAQFCAAVDSAGNAVTYSGGTWSGATPLSSDGLSWVSCPTVGFCVATSNGSALYTYSGGRWSSPTRLLSGAGAGKPAQLTSVSCASASFCLATGNTHSYAYAGGQWARGVAVEHGHMLTSVSCA